MFPKPKNRSTTKLATLYVGNLAFSRTEEDIKTLFSNFGKVHSVKIVVDPKDPKIKKGYAFVFMHKLEDAQEAIKGLNLKLVDRRTLKVSLAKPQKSKMSVPKDFEEPKFEKKLPKIKKPVVKKKRKSGLDDLLSFLKTKK